MALSIGLDLGGTKTSGAVVDESGVVLDRARRATPANDPAAMIRAAADIVGELRARHDVGCVGIACAGFIDAARERVLFAPNVAWRGEPLAARLRSAMGLPVLLENDANAAAWGEYVHGSAAEASHLVFLTIGTGVGGGVVQDGRLLRGAFGIGAELGHVRVIRDGLRCGCGARGCLEQYGSGSALVRAARELVTSGDPGAEALRVRCGGDAGALTGPDVTAAALAGDPAAIGLLADLGRWIGEGAASIAALVDPDVVVVGGGVAAAGDLLVRPAAEAYAAHLPAAGFRPRARWERARLGDDAGMIGAAAAAAAAFAGSEGTPG